MMPLSGGRRKRQLQLPGPGVTTQPCGRSRDVLSAHTRAGDPALCETLDDAWVRCHACAHECAIPEGAAGTCRVRFNRGGTLMVPWGYVAGAQCDPIEKKPFFHVEPGSRAYSFGMLGCDLTCGCCQNWVSSQALRDPAAGTGITETSPEMLVQAALRSGARAAGQHLQRAAHHDRVGGGGLQGGARGRAADRLRVERPRHAEGDRVPRAVGRPRQSRSEGLRRAAVPELRRSPRSPCSTPSARSTREASGSRW